MGDQDCNRQRRNPRIHQGRDNIRLRNSHGATESCAPVFGDDVCIDGSGLVIGTSLHGLFGNEHIWHALMLYLHEWKGIEYAPQVADSELDAYEELVDVVRENVDVGRVCKIMGLMCGSL